jgi:glutathione S-transferase
MSATACAWAAPPFGRFGTRREALKELVAQLAVAESLCDATGPYLTGASFTLADATLFPTLVFVAHVSPQRPRRARALHECWTRTPRTPRTPRAPFESDGCARRARRSARSLAADAAHTVHVPHAASPSASIAAHTRPARARRCGADAAQIRRVARAR